MSSLTKVLVTDLQPALCLANYIFEKVFKRDFHKSSAVGFLLQCRNAIVFDPSDDDLRRANI